MYSNIWFSHTIAYSHKSQWIAGPQKRKCSHWKCVVDISSGSEGMWIWRIYAAILNFSTSGLVAQYSHQSHWIAGPKNLSAAIEIVLASRLEAEMCVCKVHRPPSWIFPHPVCSQSIPSSPSGLPNPKNIGVTIGILFIGCQEEKKCVFEALRGVFN